LRDLAFVYPARNFLLALSAAKKAALKAIELDDALAEPRASLAFIADMQE
jgi:hypothetical protein